MNIKYQTIIILVSTLLICCQKVTTTHVTTTGNSENQSIIAADALTISTEFDKGIDDAITICCNPKTAITGAIVDTSQISKGLTVIDYFGNETGNTKQRTGSIAIQKTIKGGTPVSWANAGSVITITFGTTTAPGYEVLFLNNTTSIQFTGKTYITNIYGGLLQNIIAGDSLVEQVRAAVFYTYNDNATTIQLYPWNADEIRSYTSISSNIMAETRGDTVIKNFKNMAIWGPDRYGDSAYFSITTPITQNISLPSLSYNPLAGVENVENIAEPINCTYGVNNQGVPVTTGNPYGFIITWANNGGQAQNVIGYYY